MVFFTNTSLKGFMFSYYYRVRQIDTFQDSTAEYL